MTHWSAERSKYFGYAYKTTCFRVRVKVAAWQTGIQLRFSCKELPVSMATFILDALVFTSNLECSDEQWFHLLEVCKFQVDCEVICICISGLAFDWFSRRESLLGIKLFWMHALWSNGLSPFGYCRMWYMLFYFILVFSRFLLIALNW
jgi:hypothetical protein